MAHYQAAWVRILEPPEEEGEVSYIQFSFAAMAYENRCDTLIDVDTPEATQLIVRECTVRCREASLMRFTVVVAEDDSDEEWDTRDWDERDINTAATTLVDEIRNSAERHRREAAGRLLERLFQRHPTSETFIAHSTVVEEAMNAALRVPHGTPLEPDRRSFHLLAVLTPFFSDLMIRRGAIRRSAEVLNYEVDLAARRIQNAWKRRQYYTRDLMRFKSKKLRVRTEVLLLLTRGMIKGRWRMMLNSDYQGVLPVGTLEFLLLYLAGMLVPFLSSWQTRDWLIASLLIVQP